MSEEIEILREKIRDARDDLLISFGIIGLGLIILVFGPLFFMNPVVGVPLLALSGFVIIILGEIMVTYYQFKRSQFTEKMKKMSSMISCPKCGRKLETETKYCPHCGTEIA